VSARSSTLIERFQKKLDVTPGCWNWTACTTKGYGVFQVSRGVSKRAHRVSYCLYIGNIDDGMFVCHRCDNPLCVNPDHLFLGTHQDNMDDMISKGRKVSVGVRGEENKSAKLTEPQVRLIFLDDRSSRTIAAHYGIGKTIVNNIKNKTKWSHLWK